MKSIILFCTIIFGLITASSNIIKTFSIEYSDDTSILENVGSAPPVNNLDDHLLDEWNSDIDKIVETIVKERTHNDTLPNIETFLHPGRIAITKGTLVGFSTLYRLGNVTVNKLDNATHFWIPCSFKDMKFSGQYDSRLGNNTSSGTFAGTISNSLYYVIALYYEPKNRFAIIIGSKDTGNITVTMDSPHLEPKYETILQTNLNKYATRATDRTMELLHNESLHAAIKVEKEIDNRRHSTTVKISTS